MFFQQQCLPDFREWLNPFIVYLRINPDLGKAQCAIKVHSKYTNDIKCIGEGFYTMECDEILSEFRRIKYLRYIYGAIIPSERNVYSSCHLVM